MHKVNKILDKTVNELEFLWKNEPLDGDETQKISEMFLKKLDERNGNM